MSQFPAPPAYRLARPGRKRRQVSTDAPVATEGSAYHGAKSSILPRVYTNGIGERVTYEVRHLRVSPKVD